MFIPVETPDPHPERARTLLREHPEIRSLFGRNPWTAAVAVAGVALHLAMAGALAWSAAPWWAAVGAAWLFGAFASHLLFTVIHEACHKMVFASRGANQALILFANLPLVLPFGIALGHYHRVHHRTQGQHPRDPDLPTEWETRWFRGWVGKLAWQLLFPVLQLFRGVGHPKEDHIAIDGWLVANALVQVAVWAGIWTLLGPTALLYLSLSLYFLFALHPLFGRFVQEHFVPAGSRQETASYYGVLNLVSLNFGHHVEHHDFPAVPWNRLPQLRQIAPYAYLERTWYRSWAALALRFVFDRRFSVGGRVTRPVERSRRRAAV